MRSREPRIVRFRHIFESADSGDITKLIHNLQYGKVAHNAYVDDKGLECPLTQVGYDQMRPLTLEELKFIYYWDTSRGRQRKRRLLIALLYDIQQAQIAA